MPDVKRSDPDRSLSRRPEQVTTTTGRHHPTDDVFSLQRESDADEYVEGLWRRRELSWRLPPLECGDVDPWLCDHDSGDPTDHQVRGAALAAVHLLGHGLLPLFPIQVRRQMWRQGYRDLALACGSRWAA